MKGTWPRWKKEENQKEGQKKQGREKEKALENISYFISRDFKFLYWSIVDSAMSCRSLCESKMTQLYMYVCFCSFPVLFPFRLYRMLSRVPCAIQ